MFQKGFTDDEREKLAIVTGQILANSLATPRVLAALFEDHLVKEGQSFFSCIYPILSLFLSVDFLRSLIHQMIHTGVSCDKTELYDFCMHTTYTSMTNDFS